MKMSHWMKKVSNFITFKIVLFRMTDKLLLLQLLPTYLLAEPPTEKQKTSEHLFHLLRNLLRFLRGMW